MTPEHLIDSLVCGEGGYPYLQRLAGARIRVVDGLLTAAAASSPSWTGDWRLAMR